MATEFEARFLNINKEEIIKKLIEIGAEDKGEYMLEEVIFYDSELEWLKEGKLIRLRKKKGETKLTYKNHKSMSIGGAEEHETSIGDINDACHILSAIGLNQYRHQEKQLIHLKRIQYLLSLKCLCPLIC